VTAPSPPLEPGSRGTLTARSVIVSLVLTCVLGYLVLREFELESAREVLLGWNWRYAPAIIFLAMLKNVVRGLRLHAMSPANASRSAFIFAVSFQNLFFLTLPALLSEASLVYVLRRLLRVNLHQGITNVSIVRAFDLLVYLVFSALIILVVWRDAPAALLEGLLLLFGMLALAAVAIHLVLGSRALTGPGRSGLAGKLSAQIRLFRESVVQVSDRNLLARVAAYTLVNYALTIALFVIVVQSFHDRISTTSCVLLNIFTTPVFLLPVKGLGNFGTHEAAYFYGLQLLGVEARAAVGIALGTHAVDLVVGSVMTIVGLGGLAALHRRSRSAPVEPTPTDRPSATDERQEARPMDLSRTGSRD